MNHSKSAYQYQYGFRVCDCLGTDNLTKSSQAAEFLIAFSHGAWGKCQPSCKTAFLEIILQHLLHPIDLTGSLETN